MWIWLSCAVRNSFRHWSAKKDLRKVEVKLVQVEMGLEKVVDDLDWIVLALDEVPEERLQETVDMLLKEADALLLWGQLLLGLQDLLTDQRSSLAAIR